MNSTINISLPTQLKLQADEAVNNGHYASFSDLMRTALRKILNESAYDKLLDEAKKEYKSGKSIVLSNPQDIDNYIDTL